MDQHAENYIFEVNFVRLNVCSILDNLLMSNFYHEILVYYLDYVINLIFWVEMFKRGFQFGSEGFSWTNCVLTMYFVVVYFTILYCLKLIEVWILSSDVNTELYYLFVIAERFEWNIVLTCMTISLPRGSYN